MIDKKKGLMLLATLPIFVSASSNYKDGVSYANNYINQYNDYEKYLLIRKNEQEFIKGGFLSKDEFNISGIKGASYLAPGIQYWTSTDTNNGKKYVIDYSLKELDKTQKTGVRVTEYVKPETSVSGSGSYNAPWVFTEKYKVTAISSNSAYGTVDSASSIQSISKGQAAVIKFYEKKGYKFESASCTSNITAVKNNEVTISNINEDTNCVLNFTPRDDTLYTVNYYFEKADSNDYDKTVNEFVGSTDSQVQAAVSVPSGFVLDETNSITKGKISSNGDLVLNVYYKRKTHNLTLNKGTGISAVTGTGKYKFGQKVKIGATVSSGYSWNGWTGSVIAANMNEDILIPDNDITLTANAKVNAPSTPSTSTPSTPSTPDPAPYADYSYYQYTHPSGAQGYANSLEEARALAGLSGDVSVVHHLGSETYITSLGNGR